MYISPACSAVLVLIAILASLPWGAMCEGAPSSLDHIVSAATTDHPAIVFAMAHQQALVQRLPLMLSSLALADPHQDLAKHLVVGVQNEDEIKICQKLHRGCWLDDFTTPFYAEIPSERETKSWMSNATARLNWRKLEVTLHVLNMGIGVLVIDLDVIFMKSPFSLLANEELYADMFFQSESANHRWSFEHGHVNTGFFFAAPTAATKKLVDLWLGDMRLWEQSSMATMLKSKSVPELEWKAMPANVIHSFCFANSPKANQSPRPIGNHIHLFRSYLLEHEADLKDIVAFHFSCCYQPTPATCQATMMSLALSARMENEELMKV